MGTSQTHLRAITAPSRPVDVIVGGVGRKEKKKTTTKLQNWRKKNLQNKIQKNKVFINDLYQKKKKIKQQRKCNSIEKFVKGGQRLRNS